MTLKTKHIIHTIIQNKIYTILENILCTLRQHHEEINYVLQIKNSIMENIFCTLKQHQEEINYFLRFKNTLVNSSKGSHIIVYCYINTPLNI